MIAWLVSAEEVEFITASNSVVLVTVDLRVIGDVDQSGVVRERWHGAVLAGAESEGCAPGEITELLDRRIANFIPCRYTQAPTFSVSSSDGNRAFKLLMQQNAEDCALTGSDTAPNNFDSFHRSLSITLSGLDGIEIIGYSTLRPSDIGTGTSYFRAWANIDTRLPACKYDGLREALFAVGILSKDELASEVGLDVQIVGTPNAFTVLNKSSGTSEGRLSVKTDVQVFDASGAFRWLGDVLPVENPRLSAAICFHDAEVASCLRGEGPLAAGSIISLSRGPVSW